MNLRPRRLPPMMAVPVLAALAGCAGAPVPQAPMPNVPVPAGDGYVWVLKDHGRSALWGPPASEAVFGVVCNAGRVEFQHYGLAAPAAGPLRLDADGHAARYPAHVQRTDMGDQLIAATDVADPFLDHLLRAGQLRVQASGQLLLIDMSVAPLRPVLDRCGE